jgi:hypothetical protein
LIVNDLEQEAKYMQFQEKANKNNILDNFWTTPRQQGIAPCGPISIGFWTTFWGKPDSDFSLCHRSC